MAMPFKFRTSQDTFVADRLECAEVVFDAIYYNNIWDSKNIPFVCAVCISIILFSCYFIYLKSSSMLTASKRCMPLPVFKFIIQPFVQMIGGFIHPGKPMASMYFVLFSYNMSKAILWWRWLCWILIRYHITLRHSGAAVAARPKICPV